MSGTSQKIYHLHQYFILIVSPLLFVLNKSLNPPLDSHTFVLSADKLKLAVTLRVTRCQQVVYIWKELNMPLLLN